MAARRTTCWLNDCRMLVASCASPESHMVSEWGRTYLSRLRFLRPKGRPPVIYSRPVSSQHARLDSTLGEFRLAPGPIICLEIRLLRSAPVPLRVASMQPD